MDLSFNDRAKVLCGDGRDVMGTHSTTALDKREHCFLASAASSKMLALAAVFVLFQSADERFVNFDCLTFASELRNEMSVTHGLAKTMTHEPSSFVRQLECPMYLMGTDALLAGRHEVGHLKPLMKFDVAAFENGSDRSRKFALARAAAPQSGASTPD
ncbi:MAG TPA: hypothetical protein VGP28_04550 [Methylocella sp.]|jgi:hypothetical protein|nr:hypothetical protein [Methylocella sp.]